MECNLEVAKCVLKERVPISLGLQDGIALCVDINF